MFEIKETPDIVSTKIKIVGVGGAGGNAINAMIENHNDEVEYIAMNTDMQDLQKSKALNLIQLGPKTTHGRGAGSNPAIGKQAAEESYEEIKEAIQGTNLLFIVAGMGGGTGTGAAPVVAAAAKELNIASIAVVTKPFNFEGKVRSDYAEAGIDELYETINALIVVPNNKISQLFNDLDYVEAFNKSNMIIFNGIVSLIEVINKAGMINIEFSDVHTILQNKGYAIMGIGESEGEDRAINAAQQAINNPLFDDYSIEGCKSVIVAIFSGKDMKAREIEDISNTIQSHSDPNASFNLGLLLDPLYDDKIKVLVLATGIEEKRDKKETSSLYKASKQKTSIELDSINAFSRPIQTKKKHIEEETPVAYKSIPTPEAEIEEIPKVEKTSLPSDIPPWIKSLD